MSIKLTVKMVELVYTSTMIGTGAICLRGCRANKETNASVSTSYLTKFHQDGYQINEMVSFQLDLVYTSWVQIKDVFGMALLHLRAAPLKNSAMELLRCGVGAVCRVFG
jgi:hypothetical protein